MGKSKAKKRFSSSNLRKNPTNLAIATEDEFVDSSESVWQRISSQLQSGSSEERECGCASISIIGRSPEAADAFIEKKLLRIVAPLMLDENVSVKHAAIGALRNVSSIRPDICDQMIQQDIMTPLIALIQKYGEFTWQPSSKTTSNNKIDTKCEIFIEAVNLIWNLCEANDTALKLFNDSGLIPVFMKHANIDMYGYRVVCPVLQCIYTASENSKDILLNNLVQHEHMIASLRLRPAESQEDLHIQTLSHGITLNMTMSKGESIEAILPEVIEAISKILSQDQRTLIHDFSSSIPICSESSNHDDDIGQDKMEEDSSVVPRHDQLREAIHAVIFAQQTALEILTNICCDDETWEDVASDSGESDMVEESEEDDSIVPEDSKVNEVNICKMPPIALEAVQAHQLLSKVVDKAVMPAENVQELLTAPNAGRKYGGAMVLQMAVTLQSKALLCLNNLIEIMNVDELGGCQALFEVWKNLATLSFSSDKDQVVEAATSAMRAATQKLCSSKAPQLNSMTSSELRQMLEFGAKSQNSSVRTNIVHIAGSMGQFASLKLETMPAAAAESSMTLEIEGMELIAKFLIEAASRDAELRVVSEALDKIFDMFAEDYTDPFCNQVDLCRHLKQLQPGLNIKMGILKRKEGGRSENLAMASMAKMNLVRFIKYKEKRIGGVSNAAASNNIVNGSNGTSSNVVTGSNGTSANGNGH